jgi:uncharacterized membrane protein YheB (UPF0754 family)
MDKTTEQLKDELNIKEIVMQRVASYKVETLEELIMEIAHREFRLVELYGALLGFIIGFIQLGLLYLFKQ